MTSATRDRLPSLSLACPRLGFSVLAVRDLDGKPHARTAVDFGAPRAAPADQLLRVDLHDLEDEALALELLQAALGVAQPLVVAGRQPGGVEPAEGGVIGLAQPRDGQDGGSHG